MKTRIDRIGIRTCLIALAVTLIAADVAFGQAIDVPITRPRVAAKAHAEVHYGHLFETNTDNGGNVQRDSATFSVGRRFALGENNGVTIQGGYQLTAYDFGGGPASSGTGAFDWDDIHEFRAVALFDWKIDERWTVIAGGAVFGHGEGGADFGDAITAGAAVGFDYEAREGLKIGLLIGAATGIEDSAKLLPIPRVDWKFGDGWRWRLDSLATFGGRGIGTELSFSPTPEIEIAVGATRQFKRFRLADHSGFKGGVGEESSLPVFARIGYHPTPRILLDAMVGVNTNGSLRVETKTGARVESDNFDPSPIVGVGGIFAF